MDLETEAEVPANACMVCMRSHWLFVIAAVLSVAVSEDVLAGQNRTLVFVSGWPQSGTSLIQQLLTVTPHVSTMVQRCAEVLDRKKCINWNNEGQWLLGQGPLSAADDKFRHLANKALMPGAMCPSSAAMNAAASIDRAGLRDYLSRQWLHFWNASQPMLVEKSPQMLLKIPLLQGIFAGSRTKFLVVVKHPATLNNAVPRMEGGGVMDWMHHTKDGDGDPQLRTEPNSAQQKRANLLFFIDFLGHGSNSSEKNDALHWEKNRRTCSLGWIPAMEHLVRQLDTAASKPDVRILRFEYFERPSVVCRALFTFLFEGSDAMYAAAVREVCNVQFPLVTSAKASSPPGAGAKRRGQHRRLQNQQQHQHQTHYLDTPDDLPRRRLRLHTKEGPSSATQLLFRDKTMTRSVFARLQGYFQLYRDADIPDSLRSAVTQLNARLRRFGYLIQTDDYASPTLREHTLFDAWDLVMLYHKKRLRPSLKPVTQ